MDDTHGLLAPVEEPITMTRNATERSRYCEEIVRTFLRYRASEARIRHELSEFDLEALYQGLRNVCEKNDFKGVVKVHKQNDTLILIREVRK